MLLLFHASASWDLSRRCLSSASAASASGRSASRCLGGCLSPLLFSTLSSCGFQWDLRTCGPHHGCSCAVSQPHLSVCAAPQFAVLLMSRGSRFCSGLCGTCLLWQTPACITESGACGLFAQQTSGAFEQESTVSPFKGKSLAVANGCARSELEAMEDK